MSRVDEPGRPTHSEPSSVELRLVGNHRELRGVFHVAGDFDGAQVERFEELTACLPERLDDVTVDLSRTRLLDSSGLRSLIRLRERCGRSGAEISVLITKPFQRKLLEVAGLYEHLGVRLLDDAEGRADRDQGERLDAR